MMYSGQRFSSMGMRGPMVNQRSFNTFGGAPIRSSQFASGSTGRGESFSRFSSAGNHSSANLRNTGNRAGQTRTGNNLPANWRNHVVAQHSANWHRDWDRGRDHFFNGHRARFIDGSWCIFDFGFDPWWPGWYPYDYYGYGYPYPYGYGYPYGYDSGYNDSGQQGQQGQQYPDRNGYGDQSNNSMVGSAQQQLAQEGYYRGSIDGAFGPETRRAVIRYQRNHGLRVTGDLTPTTLQALGLRQVASYQGDR